MSCGRGAGLGAACASAEGVSKQLQRGRQQGGLSKVTARVENSCVFGTALMLTELGAHKDWCVICYSDILMYWLTEKRGEIML